MNGGTEHDHGAHRCRGAKLTGNKEPYHSSLLMSAPHFTSFSQEDYEFGNSLSLQTQTHSRLKDVTQAFLNTLK